MRRWALILLLVINGSPVISADWSSSESLVGLIPLSTADRQRVGEVVEHKTIGYSFRAEGVPWRIHKGDLTVPGSLDNHHALIVDGNLTIDGTYDDYGEGSGLLIVLGDLEAEHVFSWNGLYVRGAMRASGLIFGVYNDFAFEVDGGVSARGIVMDDHSADYRATRAEFEIDNLSIPEEDQLGLALRLLLPDVFTDPDSLEIDEDSDIYTFWPAYEATKARIYAGQPIFRATPADRDVVDGALVAIASDSSDRQLLAVLGRDPLIDRVVAARPDLSQPVIDALLGLDDTGVRAWLAAYVTDLEPLGGAAGLTPAVAERLVGNPATPEDVLLQIARSEDAAVRQALAEREDPPASVLALLAQDSDVEVRARAFNDYDHADRLSAADKARLADDPDVRVREGIARVDLPVTIAAKLAVDAKRDVRLALARSLATHLDRPHAAMPPAERAKLADALWADADREIANAAFVALPPVRQVALFRAGHKLAWDDIAQATRVVELMRALLEMEAALEVQGGLAQNLALPVALQLVLVKRAAGPLKTCDTCWLHETTDDVLASLIDNANVAPAALLEASRIAIRRPDAAFVNALTGNRHIPLAGLKLLDDVWAGGEDWSLSVILMHHANREMLEVALPRWYEDEHITKAMRAMRKLSGTAWWAALARSVIDELREAAATNVNTPPEQLIELVGDSSDEVSTIACYNPRLPADARETVERKGPEYLLLSPLLSLEDLADLTRSAPTADLRSNALEAHTVRKYRTGTEN